MTSTGSHDHLGTHNIVPNMTVRRIGQVDIECSKTGINIETDEDTANSKEQLQELLSAPKGNGKLSCEKRVKDLHNQVP